MKTKQVPLDKDEEKIQAGLERGEYKAGSRKFAAELQQAAQENIEARGKGERVNLRFSDEVLGRVKELAALEGLGYQTYISSVVYKVVTGQYVSRAVLEEVKDAFRAEK